VRLSPRSSAASLLFLIGASSVLLAVDAPSTDATLRRAPLGPDAPPGDWTGYRGTGVRTIFDVQPFSRRAALDVAPAGGPWSKATLTDLHPTIGAWHLLELGGPTAKAVWHLEVDGWVPRLAPGYPAGLVLEDADGTTLRCELFTATAAAKVQADLVARRAYVPLCDGKVHVRVQLEGRKTTVEWASDLLRDNVWGGEDLTVFVRDTFFKDKHLERSELGAVAGGGAAAGSPPAPKLLASAANGTLIAESLGLPLPEGPIVAGRWMPVDGQPGVFAAVTQPQLVDPAVVAGLGDRVRPLSSEERDALVYLVAFELDRFDVGYELGTDHPRLDWSDRVPDALVDATRPGPDGFASALPLQRTGQVPPWRRADLAAVFTGGFKRSHGAFQTGALAQSHDGHHYGFIEHGVVFSKLQPGLATLVIDANGELDLRTWTSADEASMWSIRHARQNGVPLLSPDPVTGQVVAGDLVKHWSAGNWASSVDGNLRSLRAGYCTLDDGDKRWLIYGYFTGATPSGMAVVFQSQGCDYAMLADMNALEHTYMAVYGREGDALQVHHLDTGMSVLDEVGKGGVVQPRFVAFPDNRDFFHLVRR
jgi:hypothetical protein